MNRRQRRAAGAQKRDLSELRDACRRFVGTSPIAELRPERRYLLAKIRPMTINDLIPGYEYEPGLTMLEIEQPATANAVGALWQIPIELPAEMREPTPENTQAAYALAYACDPQARQIIDQMKQRARPWREVEFARDLPKESLGRFVLPPEEIPHDA